MSKRMVAMMVVLGVLFPAVARQSLAQGPQEGIKVHGHWVIDVRNPDGTQASHLEFENALTSGGAGILSAVLSRAAPAVGGWTVALQPSTGYPFGRSPDFSGGYALTARVFEAALGDAAGVVSTSLSQFPTLAAAQVGTNVVLKGTATAAEGGEIDRVQTELRVTYHGDQQNSDFSGTTLPHSVALAAGQIIQVTVTLSFS